MLFHRKVLWMGPHAVAGEACGGSVPLASPDEILYPEPHRTRRLSNGGPHHPRWMVAVCPNCHREMHHGASAEERNRGCLAELGA